MGETPLEEAVLAALNAQVGVAPINQIRRSEYRSLSTLQFCDWFGRVSVGVETPYFTRLVPAPAEWKAMNANLQELYNKRRADRSRINVNMLQDAVNNAKVQADIVADYLEKEYPGNIAVAGLVYMEFAKGNSGQKPAPEEPVTNFKGKGFKDSVLISWKGVPGNSRTIYKLYQSTDNAATFTLVDFTTNAPKGVMVPTEPGKKYIFYVVASNGNGSGPKSEYFTWFSQD